MAVQNALDCSCYLCMVHFSTTETKHNMNTHTASKPKSLLVTLALYMAQFYQNRCKSRGHANKAWEQVSDKTKAVAIQAMTDTISEALKRLTGSADFPTKQSLRSYLSITSDRPSATSALHGFDDLYNELLAIFTLKHVVTVQQLEDRLAASSEAYRRQDERHAVELAKIRHDFGAATNSHEKQIATMDARITELTRLLGEKTTGINDRNVVICEHEKTIERLHQSVNSLRETNTSVVNRNTALQRKNEELVGLPKPFHWDSPTDIQRAAVSAAQGQTSITSNLVSDILKEFKIASPTNDILDMVRAACERAVASDGLLDRKNKEIVALQSKQFGSPVEKVLEFTHENGHLDKDTMGQIVHHILTTSDLAEHTRTAKASSLSEMDATALGNSRGVVGYAPVPERQYEGGVPRTEIVMIPPAKKKHDKFDIACGIVCLGGGALGILFYAAKFLGFLS